LTFPFEKDLSQAGNTLTYTITGTIPAGISTAYLVDIMSDKVSMTVGSLSLIDNAG